MAAPRFGQGSGMVNPEAPGTPVQPRIAQPTPGISTGQRTTMPSQTRGTQAATPAPMPPATLFPLPTGKPASSVSAPGGMISQTPSGTRPLPPSATRGSQTPAAIEQRAAARATATPAPAVAPTPAPAPTAPKPPKETPSTSSGEQKRRRPAYTPPEGYDRVAGYSPEASPDQILFEKGQIYARNLARGIEMSDAEVEKRFQERLKRFQDTGEPSKNKDPEDAVAEVPAEEVAEETVLTPEQIAMQQSIDDLKQMVKELQDQIAGKQETTTEQAQAPAQTGTSQLQSLAQALTPQPTGGSLANLDRTRIGQMLQVAAPIMFTGAFSDVVAAIIAAGLTPTAPELAWLEAEVAKYRAG